MQRQLRLISLMLLPASAGTESQFGRAVVSEISATCATVDFAFHGEGNLGEVYLYAKRPEDDDFLQWGHSLKAWRLDGQDGPPKYRLLMQHIPPGSSLRVKVSVTPHLLGDTSEESASEVSLRSPPFLAEPSELELHRTDPRLNKEKHDSSVCVDLHWSHPHPRLRHQPDDVFFRILYHGVREPPMEVCTDAVGSSERKCGQPLHSTKSKLPKSYETICGLRPNRTLGFIVQAFNCDGQQVESQLQAVTPPSGPAVVFKKITQTRNQESSIGFKPRVLIDWVPQIDPLIEGHAIYLGLADIFAEKLLCWVPRSLPGQIELPIKHKNHTHSEDALLLRDYWSKLPVHQEQELMVASRTAYYVGGRKKGYLESPASRFELGDWLVMEEAVECLTSFEATKPFYASRPVALAWTQAQALSMYD